MLVRWVGEGAPHLKMCGLCVLTHLFRFLLRVVVLAWRR